MKTVACLCVFLVCASFASSPANATGTAGGNKVSDEGKGEGAGQIPVEKKVKFFFADGALDEYTECEYDESLSNLLKQRRFSASGTLLEQVEYLYQKDKNMLIKKITRDAENQIKNQMEYQYNDQDLMISETLMNRSGKPVSSYSYAYDAGNRLIRRVFSNSAGVKMAETVYSYDGRGNVTSTETLSGAGQKINSTQSQYDSNGHLTGQKTLNANGQISAAVTVTWQGGNEIKNEQFGPDGTLQLRITNEYGSNGELLKKTIEDLRRGTAQMMAYEYIFKPASR
jgi:hypothetical protein